MTQGPGHQETALRESASESASAGFFQKENWDLKSIAEGFFPPTLFTLLLRIAAVFFFKTYQTDPAAYEHGPIAESLARGTGFQFNFFSDHLLPSSHQAPAIPFLLSICFLIGGIGKPAAFLMMELFNAVLGAAGVLGVGKTGEMMWDRRAGRIVAWCVAVYPPLVYAATRVQAVNWAICFLILMVYCVMALYQRRTVGFAVGAGLCMAAGALGEPILLAPAAVAIGGLVVRRQLRLALVVVVALGLGLVPWLVRNTMVHGSPVLIKSTFWYVFWQGNNLQASGTDKLEVSPRIAEALSWRISLGGLEKEITEARQQAASVDTTIPPGDVARIEAQPTEMEKMKWFREQSIATLKEHPEHYLKMCAKRAFELAWFDNTNPRSLVMAYRAPYILLLFTAAAGVVVSIRQPVKPREWMIPVTLSIAVMAVHVLIITSARFRLPLEALLFLPTGYLISKMLPARRAT